jgi:protocatechuate 3,4-dioxygenase beta subunit
MLYLLLLLLLPTLQLAQLCPVQETPADALGPFYQQNSPVGSVVAPASELTNPLELLQVSGRILSITDCEKGIANVTVEVWFAGANGYSEDEFRGQVVTDECGQYSFVQTFPALYASRPILHNHFRLSRNKEELLVSQMYFQGDEEGYVSDPQSRKMQVTQVTQNVDGSRSVEFDMYVNLTGDAKCQDEGTQSSMNGATTSNATSTGQLLSTSTPTSIYVASCFILFNILWNFLV